MPRRLDSPLAPLDRRPAPDRPRRSSRPSLETLEGRALLASTVAAFDVPFASVGGLTAGTDGALWFTATRQTPRANDPFSNVVEPFVGRITPKGAVSVIPLTLTLPQLPTAGVFPGPIVAVPGGDVWFIESVYDTSNAPGVTRFAGFTQLARVDPAGVVSTVPLPAGVVPDKLTAGSGGDLWFDTNPPYFSAGTKDGPAVGRVTPAGTVTIHSLGLLPTFSQDMPGFFSNSDESHAVISGFTAGPDGNLWFTEFTKQSHYSFDWSPPPVDGYGHVGRVTPSGAVTLFPVSSIPVEITAGPDGNVWFVENSLFSDPSGLGHLGNVTTSGHVTEYPFTPSVSAITAGPDGNLWTLVFEGNPYSNQPRLARISTNGTPTGITDPIAGGTISGLTAGPDGNLWFVEQVNSNGAIQIDRVNIAPTPAVTTVERQGVGREPTGLTVAFNRPLGPAAASDAANYSVVRTDRLGRPHGKPVVVTSAVYDAANRAVRLGFDRRLDLHRYYRLTVNGSGPGGLADVDGTALAPPAAGQPGGFTAYLHGFAVATRPFGTPHATRRAGAR